MVDLPSEKIVFTGDIIAAQLPDPLTHLEPSCSNATNCVLDATKKKIRKHEH